MVRRRLACPDCGKTFTAKLEVVIVFHECHPPKRQRPLRYRLAGVDREEILHDRRLEWARRQLGGAIEDAVPAEALLRRGDDA